MSLEGSASSAIQDSLVQDKDMTIKISPHSPSCFNSIR